MKKIVLLLFYLIISTNFVIPQSAKLIGPPGGWALKVAINPSYPHIVYSGDYGGAVFVTEDGGLTTRPVETGFWEKSLNKIAVPKNSEDLCYISFTGVTEAEKVYLRSMDKGKTWSKIQTSGRYVGHITFNPLNPDIVFIIKNDREIWRSNDKGDNWKLLHNFNNRVNSLIISNIDTSLFYAAADASIYKSVNSGHDWMRTYFLEEAFAPIKMILNPTNNNSITVQKVHSPNPGLYKTIDGGVSFVKIYDGVVNDFVINPIDTLILYGASGDLTFGQEGGILKSIDGGKNWITINNGLGEGVVVGNVIDINPQNPNELYAGVSQKGVYKTIDGGENWSLANLSNSRVWEISVNEDYAGTIITGYINGLIKTTKSGKSWYKPSFDSTQVNNTVKISFNSNNEGLLAKNNGLLGEIHKSTDLGDTWQLLHEFEEMTTIKYHTYLPNVVFGASREFIYKSIDGGENFKEVPYGKGYVLDDSDIITDFIFSSANYNKIYAKGIDSIYVSDDLGESWLGMAIKQQYEISENNTDLVIKENNSNVLYCTQRASYMQEGNLFKSIDAGETWFNIDSSLKVLDPFCSASSILLDENSSKIYVGLLSYGAYENGTNGGLYLTEDEGKNWKKIYDGEVSLIRADKSQPRNIYFGTKFGLMHLVDTLNVTAIKNEEKLIKTDFNLGQNYPNPFNPTTTIKYSIPYNSVIARSEETRQSNEITSGNNFNRNDDNVNVQLIVYDVLGREVATLVNQKQKPGAYEINFDANKYSSGIYFYSLEVNNYKMVKKMILLR